jgi:hypothetical protein
MAAGRSIFFPKILEFGLRGRNAALPELIGFSGVTVIATRNGRKAAYPQVWIKLCVF